MTREEAIKRLNLILETNKMTLNGFNTPHEPLEKEIEALDMAIKALEQKPREGKWISKPNVYGVTYCSECDFELKIDDTNYCPKCGCRMIEPQESEDKE